MKALHRKLARDLLRMKGQAVAIAMVMACGVSILLMSRTTLSSLRSAQESYYERYGFAEIFTHAKRAPNSLAERIREIPGVAQVETRVVVDVTLDLPDLSEPATGRFISVPDYASNRLNRLHLRKGRSIEPGRRGEIVVSEPFAEAHGLGPGDTVRAVINGRLDTFRIVGIALSPEYIYQIRAGDLLPDNKRFGVFWMGYHELSVAYNMEGAFNDVSLTLMPGGSVPEVLRRLDRLTEPYGGSGAFSRDDQLSHRLISDEMKQLRGMSLVPPLIFLSVAAFIINIVLSRLILTQREQIAALKAFGYSGREVGFHYLQFAFVIALLGSALGVASGAWLGKSMTGIYAHYFRFPQFSYSVDLTTALLCCLICLAAAAVGVLRAVRSAVSIPPADAMRPEPPGIYKPTLLERLGLQRLLPPSARMVLRQLERRPLRAVVSCLGIALSVAVLVVGNFMEDTVNYVIDFQYHTSQRQDMTLSLIEPRAIRALREIAHLPGVLRAEPFRSVPVRLRFQHHERRTGIMGLPSSRELFRLMDMEERLVTLPEEGLVLSEKLSELLGAKIGDIVRVEVLEGARPVREIAVSGLIRDFSGTSTYMDIRALNRMMREGETISGAFLRVDPDRLPRLYRELKNTPAIVGVSLKKAALISFEQTLAENILIMKAFYLAFACIIAFGVVYNSVHVTLSERSRELATLRVVGFTRWEVFAILLGEILVLTLVAVPLGLLLGHGLSALTVYSLETESQRFPLVIEYSTYAFAALVIALATLVSGFGVRMKIDRLDLVAVLKSRD